MQKRLSGFYRLASSERRRLVRRAVRAQRDGQREVCGILVADRRRFLRLLFVPNEATAAGAWRFPGEWLEEVERLLRGTPLSIVGTFHSHPVSEAVPGRSDLSTAPSGLLQLIYDVCGREVKLWRVISNGPRGKEIPEPVELKHVNGSPP
jgi:proteasome lid subunit RPN8/RPN11